jgi:hypothetical protein
MATFVDYSDILPDPNNKIDTAGASNSSGSAGPGFAKVKFSSNNQVQVGRTISGRGITSSPGYHMWEFSINYNPMTRAEFEPVSNFLESRRGRLYPFYTILPQHSAPQNTTFAAWCAANPNGVTVAGAHNAGSSTLLVSVGAATGEPSPGDYINISDPNDANHKKAYKIIRVETNATYKVGTTQPSLTQRKLHLIPPLTRATATGSVVNFTNPKFRVIQKGDTIEYDLDTDNLYQFSLNLEEILP